MADVEPGEGCGPSQMEERRREKEEGGEPQISIVVVVSVLWP
jgi:hypothetical protein